ncbi:hypothetical protein DFJ77DRAFT_42974 [Powellomyces hirtus]|nr:hypothetical protein DFJ77DRAFT_42974 [Powellomyces hirtus]
MERDIHSHSTTHSVCTNTHDTLPQTAVPADLNPEDASVIRNILANEDFYARLGVDRNATTQQIRRAYLRRSKVRPSRFPFVLVSPLVLASFCYACSLRMRGTCQKRNTQLFSHARYMHPVLTSVAFPPQTTLPSKLLKTKTNLPSDLPSG